MRFFKRDKEKIMRKNVGAKPYVFPMPVLIVTSYNGDGTANAMNAAWGTISDMNQISIYLSAGHKTVKNILERKAFTVSIADAKHVAEADYFGVISGNKVTDKVKAAGMTHAKSEFVDAPVINEFPLALECKFISYDKESELMLGEIVNVSIDENILTDGKIDMNKFQPISYDPANSTYHKIGEKVGNAFADGMYLKHE
jgi:flavin reductase (DIM6/NTAB) family NADH-FMN oxidoreductase RutF